VYAVPGHRVLMGSSIPALRALALTAAAKAACSRRGAPRRASSSHVSPTIASGPALPSASRFTSGGVSCLSECPLGGGG
jgi:hypothetical protein